VRSAARAAECHPAYGDVTYVTSRRIVA